MLYVGVYTPLKRRSVAAVYVGAIPGATPIVMGWTSVTGSLDPGAIALFAILFFWQLPHFMAISLYRRSEFASAGIKILPLVYGDRATRWHMLCAALGLAAATFAPHVLGLGGPAYVAVAGSLALGTLLGTAYGLLPRARGTWARGYFLATLVYLPALLATLALSGA
jgi:protoheme IX farnesyltransferase